MSIFKLPRGRVLRSPVSEPPSPERTHKCNFEDGACGKAFARKSDLQRHLRIHKNERPFECKYRDCEKSFIQRSALVVHMRTHTGERPHKCESCRKAFADSSSLARHRRIHTGNKPYQCIAPGCGNMYCRKVTLTRHYKSLHPELNMPSAYHVPGALLPPALLRKPRPRRSALSRKRKLDYSSSEEEDDDEELIDIKHEVDDDNRPHGRAAPYPSKGAARSARRDGGRTKAKRQRKRDTSDKAYLAYAYSPISTRTRRGGGGMKPKVMPWQEEDVGGFQPDQLALEDGKLPLGLDAPIKLQALMDDENEMERDYEQYSPEPELVDIADLPGFYPPSIMEPLVSDPMRFSNQSRLVDNSPLLVHPQPIPLHVQVDTASFADNMATYSPQSVDTESFDPTYDEACHLAFTPTPIPYDYGTDSSPESLWGPQIQYPMVPHYSPVSSSSSTLVDGRSYSCTSATTLAPLALSPSANLSPYERRFSDGSLSIYSAPDATYSPYTEKLDGYYTPVTPGPTYWHDSRLQHTQLVYLQPYTPVYPVYMQRVASDSSVIGLGIANVSLGGESMYASEPYQASPTLAPILYNEHRPVTEEEYDQLPDEAPTFIKQEPFDSDDDHAHVVEDDTDSDYVEERPKSRKKHRSSRK